MSRISIWVAVCNGKFWLIIAFKFQTMDWSRLTSEWVQPNDVLCLFMWIVFDEWVYKKNLKSLRVVLLVMKPLNVWHLAHQGCTRFTAPLMVWHPFRSPLSTFQTCSHYFQQLFCSRCPERHDRKSTQSGRFFPIKDRLSVTFYCLFVQLNENFRAEEKKSET